MTNITSKASGDAKKLACRNDCFFLFYWPRGDGAPWATTQYHLRTWTRQVLLICSIWPDESFVGTWLYNINRLLVSILVTVPHSINHFRFSLHSSVMFLTSPATLRGGLSRPSCAGGARTYLPRRHSQQILLDRSNYLGIVNLL